MLGSLKIFLIGLILLKIPFAFSQHPVEKKLKFAKISPGKFWMGSPKDERGRFKDEKRHRVTITKSFSLSQTEITQYQWFLVTGFNPSYFSKSTHCPNTHKVIDLVEMCPFHPVENIKWIKIEDFLKKLNAKASFKYRLPTEAEWEYAARSGTNTSRMGNQDLEEYAWYEINSRNQTQRVALKKPNAWGLYDMSGNVWEWVQDWYSKNYYNRSPKKDPKGPKTGTHKVMRGGSWYSPFWVMRMAHRGYQMIDDEPSYQTGFRIVRED